MEQTKQQITTRGDILIYLTDEEVEVFATIVKNKMYYNNNLYKIVRVTLNGYYVHLLQENIQLKAC